MAFSDSTTTKVLSAADRPNDRVGVQRPGLYVARRDPALESVPLQGLDNSIRGGNILRGVTDKGVDGRVGDIH